MRVMSKLTNGFREVFRGYNEHFMKWSDFTIRVEAQSGVLDTDRVLQILVQCPTFWDSLDLCAVVKPQKRGIIHRTLIRYTEESLPRGYLMVWNHAGIPSHPDKWHENAPSHDLPVPNYQERRAWNSITWGELKHAVESHPDYQQHGRVGTINLTACKLDDLEIKLRGDHSMGTDLMISGRAKETPDDSLGAPGSVRRLLGKEAYKEAYKDD
mgnify:FL=1